MSGKGYKSDIIIKDRYKRVWALDSTLNILWFNFINTGHYPYAYDVDRDGKDEVLTGYSLIDDNGDLLWNLDDQLQDHADGIAMLPFYEGDEPMVMCAASDEGMFFANAKGEYAAISIPLASNIL